MRPAVVSHVEFGPEAGSTKPREVRINPISENVLEPAFDAKPFNMPPHLGEVCRLMVKIMDLWCPIFFNGDHRVGICRTQMKLKKLDTILLERRANEGSCQG